MHFANTDGCYLLSKLSGSNKQGVSVLERSSLVFKLESVGESLVKQNVEIYSLISSTILSCRFLQDSREVSTLRTCFAGLWSLEGDGSETILDEAINAPDGFVLKPQREGGGTSHSNLSGNPLTMH